MSDILTEFRATLRDIMRGLAKLEQLVRIEEGIRAADAGQLIDHAEVMRRLRDRSQRDRMPPAAAESAAIEAPDSELIANLRSTMPANFVKEFVRGAAA